jgi:large subunit ribosomal protein L28
MAKCGICGKGVSFGIKLSHSHRRTNRSFKPNVQKVKAVVNGTPCRVHACTRCLRSGKVTRAQRTYSQAEPMPEAQAGLQELAVESVSMENATL